MKNLITNSTFLHIMTAILFALLIFTNSDYSIYMAILTPVSLLFCYLAAYSRAYKEGIVRGLKIGSEVTYKSIIKILDDKIKEDKTKKWR